MKTLLPVLLVTGLVAGCTTAGGQGAVQTLSARSGGSFCASYSGSKGSSGSGAQDLIRDRRCFATLAACQRWYRRQLTLAPSTFSSRRCGR